MAYKTFKLEVNKRAAKPRSKRLRGIAGSASTTAKSTVVKVTGAGNIAGVSEHTHSNKSTLDRISADEAGYLSLDVLTETTDSEGNQVVEKSAEKVKAGYADESAHAVNADEAKHALKADDAAEAAHAVNADEAKHAQKADDAEKWNGKRMVEMMNQPVRSSDEVAFAKVTAERVVADRETDGTVVSSGNFDGTSALTGTGYGIMKEGNNYRMAVDYLTVRKGMKVAELVIQEYKSVGGVLVVSACNGEIEKVHKWSSGGGYDVYIKDFDKNPQFVAGDYVRCARWDSETNSYVGYWVKVVAVPTDADGYKCLNLMASEFAEGVEPQEGDQLVQFGNADDTSRQGLILISVENGQPNVTAYDGINSTSVDMLEKMCARLGDLNGIVIDDEELRGYGLWTDNLYLHSGTTQAFTEIVAGLNAGITEAGQKAEAARTELASYKTEVTKEFEAADDKFTSAYKAATTAVGNLLLETNQGAKNWIYNSDSTEKPDISGYTDEGINTAFIEFVNQSDSSAWEMFMYPLRTEKIVAGATYTLSVEVKEINTRMYTPLRFNLANGNGSGALCALQTSTQTTQPEAWVKFTFTFKATATGASGGTQYVRLIFPAEAMGQMGVLQIRNLMLAPGMEAMPWAKAPEDITAENLDAEVAALEKRASTIEQTVEGINQTVTQHTETLTAQGKRITANGSAIKQNADTISSEVTKRTEGDNELSSKIEQTAENIALKLSEKNISNINHAIGTETAFVKNTNFDGSNFNKTHKLYDVTGFKTGDMITVSFDWEWAGLTWAQSDSMIFVQFSDVYGYLGVGFELKSGGANSGHHFATITLGQKYNTSTDIVTSDTAFIYVGFRYIAQATTDGYFKVSNLKVELGDTETAWTARTDDFETTMLATGIDINHRKITVTADNFVVRNNEGETTAMVDGNGKLSTKIINADELITKRLIAVNTAGQVVSTTNIVSQDGRYYTHYPVDPGDSSTIYAQEEGYNIGFPVSVMGYDAATDSVLTVNNRKGKARWRLAVGTDGGKYGVVTEFDKWNTVGMAQKSAAIDEDSIQSVIDGLIFPASVEFQEISGGEFTATPLYGTLDMPTMLQVSYKEFDPGQDSAYDTHKGHVKVWDLYESSLEDDFDFTTGVTGVFLRTTRPVQGVVRNNTATGVVSVTFTWTLYIYENGVLATTRTQAMTYIQ